jgi:Zn finger protein HypA/HybF involved in hydrogenase expression
MGQTSLLSTVKSTFPALNIETGDDFRWSPTEQTVYTGPLRNERDLITLLHEIGHAQAGHNGYNKDVELLTLEREAWTIARDDIAPKFDIVVSEELIEEALDSYRDWLHARSRCPECEQNGIQQTLDVYTCLLCTTSWRVNDARRCGLKRYRLNSQKTPA